MEFYGRGTEWRHSLDSATSYRNPALYATIPLEMRNRHLILASRSPRRRELLELLGLPFEIRTPDVIEIPRANETPRELVARLSRAKAHAVAVDGRPSALVLACDTTVSLHDGGASEQTLGKPRGAAEARAMLRRLRGRSHVVYSAPTTRDVARGSITNVVTTRLTMRPYTDEEIDAYVASGDPMDKAGSYAIQHRGFRPVAEVEGCYANVMGLPLCHVARHLLRLGLEPGADVPKACQAHTGFACRVYEQIVRS